MSNYNHVTTVIFDMDGTLIEHTWQLSYLCSTLFVRFAEALAPVTEEEFFDCYWAKSADTWYMMADGVIDGKTASTYGYINTLRMLQVDTSLAQPMADYWVELVLGEALPFDDTFTVLEAVRQKYTTGILTNGYTFMQRQKIERHNLDAHVDFSIVSEEAGYHKPDRRIFAEALKLAGNKQPQETIYVGDNLKADIGGAQGAGISPIFMNPRDNFDPPVGVIKIKRLSELLTLLDL